MTALNAYIAGQFSSLAYRPIGDPLPEGLSMDWREDVALSREVRDDNNVVQARIRVFVNVRSKEVTLNVKGSSTVRNFKSDLLDRGNFEYGAIKDVARDIVQLAQTKYSTYRIVTNGHSLGAGLSQGIALEHNLDGYGQNAMPIPVSAITAARESTGLADPIAAYHTTNRFQITNIEGDIATDYFGKLQNNTFLDRAPTTIRSVLSIPARAGYLLSPLSAALSLIGAAAGAAAHLIDTWLSHTVELQIGEDGRFIQPLPEFSIEIDSESLRSHLRVLDQNALVTVHTLETEGGQFTAIFDKDGPLLATQFAAEDGFATVEVYEKNENSDPQLSMWAAVGRGVRINDETGIYEPYFGGGEDIGTWENSFVLNTSQGELQAYASADESGVKLQLTSAADDGNSIETWVKNAWYEAVIRSNENTEDGSWRRDVLYSSGDEEHEDYNASSGVTHSSATINGRQDDRWSAEHEDGSREYRSETMQEDGSIIYHYETVSANGDKLVEYNHHPESWVQMWGPTREVATSEYRSFESSGPNGWYEYFYRDFNTGNSTEIHVTRSGELSMSSKVNHADGSSDLQSISSFEGMRISSHTHYEPDGSWHRVSERQDADGTRSTFDEVFTRLAVQGSWIRTWQDWDGNAGIHLVSSHTNESRLTLITDGTVVDTYEKQLNDHQVILRMTHTRTAGVMDTGTTTYQIIPTRNGWTSWDMSAAQFDVALQSYGLPGLADFGGPWDPSELPPIGISGVEDSELENDEEEDDQTQDDQDWNVGISGNSYATAELDMQLRMRDILSTLPPYAMTTDRARFNGYAVKEELEVDP